ncbi:helix-turn-helix domain-containing protein [Cohnella suwonensis]|uniref:Helix-turn-helix domain-containing protein n=1 Tax=Cohnella suwonensis TaxID=696072 RepID=A0ABW0LN74_9BACL
MFKKAEGFEAEKIIVLPAYLLGEMVQYPLVRQLYVTDIGYYPKARNHYLERARGCESSILIYCIGGAGWISKGNGESRSSFKLSEGELAILPADVPHAYGADESNPWSIYWFHFSGEMAPHYVRGIEASDVPLSLSHREAEKFVFHFHEIYDTLSSKSYSVPHLAHVSQTIAYLLSGIGLLPGRKVDARKKTYIENAMKFMAEHLELSFSLDELAQHAQISKQHLNTLFKAETGFAPIDYFHRMQMRRACQLFDLSELSVKEVCHGLGFKDPYYFSRLFKKIIGLSPSAYRGTPKG